MAALINRQYVEHTMVSGRRVPLRQLLDDQDPAISPILPCADLVYRPVIGLSPSAVAVAWRQGSHSLAVAAFVRAAVEAAEHNTEARAAAGPGQ